MDERREEKGSCRALSASAAALILHYGLGAMKSYFGETSKRRWRENLSMLHLDLSQCCDSAVNITP